MGVRSRIVEPYDTAGNWYIADNFIYGDSIVTADNWNGGVQGSYAQIQKNKRSLAPFPSEQITTTSPQKAFDLVLAFGGASLHRDTVDVRITNEARTGTATYGGTWGLGRGIIDSQDSVGGWPLLHSLPAPADSDHDGMPDDWENANGLNPLDSTDGAIITADGYSNLEHYLNSLVSANPPDGVSNASSTPPIPKEFALSQNYPNPFNPSTTITYEVPTRSRVTLEVFNILGMRMATLVDGVTAPGTHQTQFNAAHLPSGVYFYWLQAGNLVIAKKMLLLK